MYAIVFKEDRIPMCARLRADGPDAIVYWETEARAVSFLESKGPEFVAQYEVLRLDETTLEALASALSVRHEELELVPYP